MPAPPTATQLLGIDAGFAPLDARFSPGLVRALGQRAPQHGGPAPQRSTTAKSFASGTSRETSGTSQPLGDRSVNTFARPASRGFAADASQWNSVAKSGGAKEDNAAVKAQCNRLLLKLAEEHGKEIDSWNERVAGVTKELFESKAREKRAKRELLEKDEECRALRSDALRWRNEASGREARLRAVLEEAIDPLEASAKEKTLRNMHQTDLRRCEQAAEAKFVKQSQARRALSGQIDQLRSEVLQKDASAEATAQALSQAQSMLEEVCETARNSEAKLLEDLCQAVRRADILQQRLVSLETFAYTQARASCAQEASIREIQGVVREVLQAVATVTAAAPETEAIGFLQEKQQQLLRMHHEYGGAP
ncbi:hypothetical protein DIPPA_20853 [Diplonema papillatum]|nr:hypothetical protein DIPPA_20853 [Diplonema papillatum]